MDEVNSNGLSVSFRVDDGVIEHNNREIIAKNVDSERIRTTSPIAEKTSRKSIVVASGAEQKERKVFSKLKEKILSSAMQTFFAYYERRAIR